MRPPSVHEIAYRTYFAFYYADMDTGGTQDYGLIKRQKKAFIAMVPD
jgi:hypothetical protein